jgi:hypothetical protein
MRRVVRAPSHFAKSSTINPRPFAFSLFPPSTTNNTYLGLIRLTQATAQARDFSFSDRLLPPKAAQRTPKPSIKQLKAGYLIQQGTKLFSLKQTSINNRKNGQVS